MSLVAYDASSDEESENEDEDSATQVILLKPQATNRQQPQTKPVESTNGHISDDDDDFVPQEVPLQKLNSGRLTLALPKPKIEIEQQQLETDQISDQVTSAIAKLPKPRTAPAAKPVIEEDDEFLHKKAVPESIALEKPPPPPAKARIKISIPSLKDFSDVDKEKAEKLKRGDVKTIIPKGSGLLSILPQAKSERDFSKKSDTPTLATASAPRNVPAFVPDTVKHRRAAHNTEAVDGLKASSSKSTNKKSVTQVPIVNASDSEDDDESGTGDFFSLHTDQQLPEVSTKEINALVNKRAAKMVETSNKYLEEEAAQREADAERLRLEEEEMRLAQKRYHEKHLNNEAMDALVGKNAKRRRKEAQGMQVIEISGTEVLPDREEWMRTSLASSTTFQPTGVLTDEEPVAGTRRKHQITYLAHKAKANEAELQAMWSANRQNRRATQSKYGF